MCEHERTTSAAVFSGLLELAEGLGTVKRAQLYEGFLMVEGQTKTGHFFLSLTLEEGDG